MAKDQTYPGASTVQWFAKAYPGSAMDANCGCFHTTETVGWPGYGGGATAPNMTSRPDFAKKILLDRVHFPVDMSSRALRNLAGGVQTNTLNVFQWELVATCDPAHAKTWKVDTTIYRAGVDYIYVPTAPLWWYKAIAKRVLWLEKEHGIPATSPIKSTWTPYPKSYANGGGQRFTFAEWRNLKGWCGHQHVPENVHGDPGAFNWPQVDAYVKALKAASVPALPPAPLAPPTLDKVTLIEAPGGSRYHLTPRGLVWIPSGSVILGPAANIIKTDLATWRRYRTLYPK